MKFGRPSLSLDRMFSVLAEEVEASVPEAVPANDHAILWSPLEPQAGRGLRAPDGRLVSPQRLAYESLADELFFGGAGGGGKTDLGLGLAVTQHRNSIIFRSEFTQFRGADGIIERSREIIGMRGELNEGIFLWRNLPGNRALEFGAARSMKDAVKYRGRPHDLKVFDELPEIPEQVYRFLIGWLRTSHTGQRMRVVSTGNPPMTTDGEWVIRYWAPWLDEKDPHPAKPGELRFFAHVGGKDVERPDAKPFWAGGDAKHKHELLGQPRCVCEAEYTVPRSRTFIPAYVEDNPHYMRSGYDQVLNAMPEPMRSQMRYGMFNVRTSEDPFQVFPTAWVVAAQERWTPGGGGPLTAVGCDPSRGGKDEFVMAPRHGAWFDELVIHDAKEAPDGIKGAALIFAFMCGDGTVPIQIDIGGAAGSSVYDQARVLNLRAIAMNGSNKSVAKDRSGKLGFVNKRAEWHWRLREALEPVVGQDIALPPDPQLRADLCAIRWKPMVRGIQVEAKEEIKARIGRSPDRGEAVIYACADEYTAKPTKKVVLW